MHTPDREINPPSFYKEEEAITDNRPTITVHRPVTQQMEICIPYFCKSRAFFYKITEDRQLITVSDTSIEISHRVDDAFLFFDREDWKQIDSEEFAQIWIETLNKLES